MNSGRVQSPDTETLADTLGLQPLTARSVILSVLLGTHPPRLPVKILVRTAELFGISEGTTRVALSRLAADGDVVAEDRDYRLTARLLDRQRRRPSPRSNPGDRRRQTPQRSRSRQPGRTATITSPSRPKFTSSTTVRCSPSSRAHTLIPRTSHRLHRIQPSRSRKR